MWSTYQQLYNVRMIYNTVFSKSNETFTKAVNLLGRFSWGSHQFSANIRQFSAVADASVLNTKTSQHRKEKNPFYRTEATCLYGFLFCYRGVCGGLRSPRLVHQRCVSLWRRLDRTRMRAEGLSPTLHRPRSLSWGQVWLPPGLDGWTLHHWWATMTHAALYTYTHLTEGHELQRKFIYEQA